MKSIKCPQCGLVNWSTAESCKRCEFSFVDAGYVGTDRQDDGSNNYQSEQSHQWTNDAAYPGPDYQSGGYQNAGYQSGGYQSGGYQSGGYENSGYQSSGYGYGGYAAPKSSGLAITSLVIGGINMLACGLLGVGSLIGLITGIVALTKAKRHPLKYGGEGLAIAGIVLSVISFVSIGIMAAMIIPNVYAGIRAANEGAAINRLRTIAAAEATYQATTGEGKYGSLSELAAAELIDPKMASGNQYGYKFEIQASDKTFEATATPARDGDMSSRSFYVAEDGVIHGAKKGGLAATAYDPPLNPEPGPGRRMNFDIPTPVPTPRPTYGPPANYRSN